MTCFSQPYEAATYFIVNSVFCTFDKEQGKRRLETYRAVHYVDSDKSVWRKYTCIKYYICQGPSDTTLWTLKKVEVEVSLRSFLGLLPAVLRFRGLSQQMMDDSDVSAAKQWCTIRGKPAEQ